LGKSRLRDKAEHPAKPDGFYHWYDDPQYCCQEVHGELLHELIRPYVSKNPLRSIGEKQRQQFLQIMRKDTTVIRVTVAKLLEMCKLLGIAPDTLERMKLFKRGYPISLVQPQIYKLMTHLINEGDLIYRGRNYSTTGGHYYNLDMSLHNRVVELITSLGGKWSRGLDSDNIPYTYVDAAVTRLLIKAGMVPGKKA
jgi:hypothetical protein